MLDDLELPLVQQLDGTEHQERAQHAVPALEGDFLQPLGRHATAFTLEGVIANEDGTVAEQLKKLREKFRAATPVNFVTDIATATRVDTVLIEEMSVRELAGKTQRFEYAFALREFIPAPAPETEPPPPKPPPLTTGLIVEVIVEGQPGFDFGKVTVTVDGHKEDGSSHNVTLINRTNNIWTEDDFPPGNYTVKAEVTDPPMSNAVTANVLEGQKTKVTIVLRPGSANNFANMFVVHFRFDNAFVEPCLCEVLKQVAQYASDHPDEKLVIVGNTDQIGSPANITASDPYNQSLSERRARAVFAYLTFGRDAAASVAEWNALRQNRTASPSLGDKWGTRQYQYMLQNLGFYPGNVDGDHGMATDAAVQAYRQSKGLPPDTVVDDAVWQALITDYLSQGNLSIPESQFLPNKALPGDSSCEDGILKWIGVASQDPVLNQHIAWRPNRRTEMLFIRTDQFPCQEPQPDTFNLPAPGAVNGNWCLGPGDPHQRTCFVVPHVPPGGQPQNNEWSRVSAESGTLSVRGSIMFENGTPAANMEYILIAPNGEFIDGERSNGEGIPGRTDANGQFDYSHRSPTMAGIYTIEVKFTDNNPHVAHLASEPPSSGKGSVVCARLDTNHTVLDVIIFDGVPAPAVVTPSITLARNFVIVKKPHTNPARVEVTLRSDATFSGTGSLDRLGNTAAVRLFTAATGGTEIAFNGTDNVFTGAALAAGVTLFAEAGPAPSAAADDYTLTLTLNPTGVGTTVGAPATAALTAVLFTLDIALSRPAPGANPPIMSEADKINVGRHVQFRDATFTHERAMLIVRQPTPSIPVTLELLPQNGRVQAFTNEIPSTGQTSIAAPLVLTPGSIPAVGSQFFVEGVTISTGLRDTGYLLRVQGVSGEVDRVAMTVVMIEMITQANTVISRQGDNACLMVSKFVTNVNLLDVATFSGPSGANPDPDTFRVQLKGLPAGEAPQIRLDVVRGGNIPYTHTFDMVNGVIGRQSVYRINEHIRLVSNDVDDAHLAHQTPKVQLEDIVRATLILNGQDIIHFQLPVGRPPAENGSKAIRTVDIHFVTLQGVNSNPALTIERMSEDWAQVGIRYRLVSQETRTPVTNVLTIDGTANRDGQLSVDVTPQGGATVNVIAVINRNDPENVIAQKLAAAISANAGLVATHHRHQDIFIVMVNKGQEVNFANINNNIPSVLFQEPALNFTDEINSLEGSVLGLNFSDNDLSNVDMIAVGRIHVLPPSDAATGGDFLSAHLPGWHNVCIIREEGVDTSDADQPFLAGHEMSHALLDGGNGLHSNLPNNLVRQFQSAVDTLDATKRLTVDQNIRARLRSGPNTVPPLLKR